MRKTTNPDSRIPPIGRRGRPGNLWNAAVPFAILLVALGYVPYASQQATGAAALASEQARHRLLVNQVGLRVQADAEHLVAAVSRLGTTLSKVGLGDASVATEIDAAWNMLQSYQDVDAMIVLDPSDGIVQEVQASLAEGLQEREAFLASVRRFRDGSRRIDSEIWSAGLKGLHMTIESRIVAPGGVTLGMVAVSVALDRMIARLFQGTGQEAGVTFTVMSSDGSVLLHSGLSPRGPATPASMSQECGSCHGADPIRDRVLEAHSGGGRHVIEGVERVVAWAPVKVAGQTWSISASTSTTEVLRPVAQQAIVSLFFTLAVVVVVLMLGLLLRRGHIRQIRLEESLAAQTKLLALAREKEQLDRELEAARRMASIGEMVARVAHEVKNPLQYIGTASELLASMSQDPAAQALIGDMRTGVKTLDAIITELLDFSRPMRLAVAPVALNEVVREVARRVIPAEGVEVSIELASDLPEVPADGYKVRQVLENIVRNAVDALPPAGSGARRITLATERVTDGKFAGGARIRIRDTGRGIPPEDVPRIWEPFFTSKTHGSGLGLAVVRRIIDAHRGQVEVESTAGVGTTFTIALAATLIA